MTRYTVTVCPGCGRRLGVNGVDIHRLKSETPRTGVDVLAVGSPPSHDPASTPVQAASPLASRVPGERG